MDSDFSIKKYFFIWYKMAGNAVAASFVSRFGAIILILGKFIRLGLNLLFLYVLSSKISTIAGYTLSQMIFFFLTYQLLDTLPQFFFREVYRFRGYVVSGDFDFFLIKPLSPLFRALFGGSDILDAPVVIVTLIALFFSVSHLGIVSFEEVLLYFLLMINAFLLAFSFHVFVLALGVVSTEVDNAMMLYRDLAFMGRFPVDIYHEPLRGVITFIVPVGIMMTVPAKALMGLVSPETIVVSFSISFLFFVLSFYAWKRALREYGSASS